MTAITRENVEQLLDSRQIKVAMRNGNWWTIRRSGLTQRWKRDKNRIRIPFKMGMYGHGAIETSDFRADGTLNPDHFKVEA